MKSWASSQKHVYTNSGFGLQTQLGVSDAPRSVRLRLPSAARVCGISKAPKNLNSNARVWDFLPETWKWIGRWPTSRARGDALGAGWISELDGEALDSIHLRGHDGRLVLVVNRGGDTDHRTNRAFRFTIASLHPNRGTTMKRIAIAVAVLAALSGCASWSTTSVRHADKTVAVQETDPDNVKITAADITDRKYVSLGEISATVRKTTIFNADPTRKMVNEKLQERAAQLGADAVILVKYDRSGFSPLSWGSLEGTGQAVKFQ